MAFIQLFPATESDWLPIDEMVARLNSEFRVVQVDHKAGRDHVRGMIAATLRFSDSLPHKAQQLTTLRSVQNQAVRVAFGDDLELLATSCLVPQHALFFDSPDEIDGPARLLVNRCARVLNYQVFEG